MPQDLISTPNRPWLSRVLARRDYWMPCAIAIVFVILAWPKQAAPISWPDSTSYVNWPSDYMLDDDFRVMGSRPPVYPLFLKVVGTGQLLMRLQTLLSIGAWCFLGWSVARTFGVLVGGIFASSLPIWRWNVVLVTESISISLMAASLGATLLLMHRWTWKRFIAWGLLIAGLGFTRDVNLYLVIFLAAPAITQNRIRALTIVSVVILIFVMGSISLRTNERWRWPLTNVITARILPDADALAYFKAAGMPANHAVLRHSGDFGTRPNVDMKKEAPEFGQWLGEKGVWTYQKWLILTPKSHVTALKALINNLDFTGHGYTPNLRAPRAVLFFSRLYSFKIYPAIWVGILALPILEFWLRRHVGVLSAFAATLLVATYSLAYVGYHADTMDLGRHLLPAAILYRVTTGVGAIALFAICYLKISSKGDDRSESKCDATNHVPLRKDKSHSD